jgi:hypothetical protein
MHGKGSPTLEPVFHSLIPRHGASGWTLWLTVLVCVGLAQGCASGTDTTVGHPGHVGRRIVNLRYGDSISDVKAKLGEPASEVTEDDTHTSLNYIGWHLYFEAGRLAKRIHEIHRLHSGRVQGGGPAVAKVLNLKLGMSVGEVVHRLGKPDVVELEYGASPQPERILRYGPWEFRFRKGVLIFRQEW